MDALTNSLTRVFSNFIYLIFIVGFVYKMVQSTRKPKAFPPGPTLLPFLGSMLQFKCAYNRLEYLHLTLQYFSEVYGSVVGFKLGKDNVVVVSGYENVKQVMSSEKMEGRPDGFFYRLRSFGKRLGVVFIDGSEWREQRKFCVNQLRSLGFGKSTMHQIIQEESVAVIDYIHKLRKNGPIYVQSLFDVSTANTIWKTLTDERFELDDPRLVKLAHNIHAAFKSVDTSGGLLTKFPYIRFIAPELSGFNTLIRTRDEVVAFLKDIINTHRNSIHKNFINNFMEEIDKRRNDPETSFTEEQLLMTLEDLFMAGMETTSSTLTFAILLLSKHPEIQKKMCDELNKIAHPHEYITVDHKLVYVEAFIMETLRYSDPAPIALPHRALEDYELNGYIIPKDSVVLMSVYSVHMEKSYWHEPERFNPDRFISEDGNLIVDSHFMPFGIGRRKCTGEMLAKANLIMFVSNIVHKFEIKAVDTVEPKILEGVTIIPELFKMEFIPRW